MIFVSLKPNKNRTFGSSSQEAIPFRDGHDSQTCFIVWTFLQMMSSFEFLVLKTYPFQNVCICPLFLKKRSIQHQSRSPRQAAYLKRAGAAPKEEAKTRAQIALDMRTGQNVGRMWREMPKWALGNVDQQKKGGIPEMYGNFKKRLILPNMLKLWTVHTLKV